MTEDKLLNGLKRGRRGYLEKAIEVYTPYVSVIVYNVIGAAMTKEDIEEVISDTFVLLWKSASALDSDKGTLRTYLGAIARNCAKKKLRELYICGGLDENIPSADDPTYKTEADEEREALLELIHSLGEPDSEIFLRHYWYGERVSQIAAAIGINKSTITTKLQRGRKRLKEILEKEARQ